jgi:hypothetical protein
VKDKSWVAIPKGRKVEFRPIKAAIAAADPSKTFSGCCVAIGCVIEARTVKVVRMILTLDEAKALSGELVAAISKVEAKKGGAA